MLFVYGSVDNYLFDSGRLGFVITQTIFKTRGAGDGFRQLHFLRDKKKIVLKPIAVHDLSNMQVFEGATNRTAVFVCEKQRKDFSYPIPYNVWSGPGRIDQDESLVDVLKGTRKVELRAVPVEPGKASSPWLTAGKKALTGIQKVIAKSEYRAFEGVNTGGLTGCFWIRVIQEQKDGSLLIENLYDVGKIKVEPVSTSLEPDLVYPLLRGRDVLRWRALPSAHIILAQDPQVGKGIAESEMKRLPRTYAYLRRFEGDRKRPERGTLRGRALYKQYFDPSDPFYSMYNVGPSTLAKWKVMWPEVGHTVRAGVCGPQKLNAEKPALPDHTIVAVACDSGEEAHYICALLNSAPAQSAASGYIVLHPSPHIMEHIGIKIFDSKNPEQRRLSELSKACHAATIKGDTEKIESLEAEIDKAAAELWGITDDELKAILESLAETGNFNRAAEEDEEE